MHVSAVQYNPSYLDVEQNLARLVDLLADVQTDLLVLPELFATGYFFLSEDDLHDVAEELPNGRTMQWLRTLAADRNLTVVAGLPEKRGNRIYNSAVTIRADASYAVYRKTHLYDREKHWFTPGDAGFRVQRTQTADGEPYAVGTMICFDWYYPESARSLALAGADVIAHPSNLVRKDCPRAMPIRALENHVYTATANRVGVERSGDDELTFIGQSLICDPAGRVLASAGAEDETVLTVEIDVAAARNRQITPNNDLLRDRRPSLYRTDIDLDG